MRSRVVALAVLWFVAFVGIAPISQTLCPPCCTVEVLFTSPRVDNVIEAKLIALLDQATSTVDIAIYSFTDDQLGDAVVQAHRRGVKVRVLLDDGQEEAQGGEYPKLVAAGVPVVVEKVTGLMHHKFVVIDGQTTVTGSYNWTDNADDDNFENVVVVVCSEIAATFTEEFNRLWEIYGVSNCSDAAECLGKLNTVTYTQLLGIPRIGKVTAFNIVERQPFASLGELVRVPQVGPARCCAVLTYLGCKGCCAKYCKE